MAVKHGGNLIEIAAQYGTEISQWLDLSTGVSPFTYPVNEIPCQVWNRLPQANDGLEQAAKHYYNAPTEPVAVAGSQAAIMLLPVIVTAHINTLSGVVALPRVGYKEHEKAWKSFVVNYPQWSLIFYDEFPSTEQIESSDVVVVINPNNPTGAALSRDYLDQLRYGLAQRNGVLVVDEAFADIANNNSMLTPNTQLHGLISLR
jgi:cobalamin biosynthetic protein CobC